MSLFAGLGALLQNRAVQGALANIARRKLEGKSVRLKDALIGGVLGGGLGAVERGMAGAEPMRSPIVSSSESAANAIARAEAGEFSSPPSNKVLEAAKIRRTAPPISNKVSRRVFDDDRLLGINQALSSVFPRLAEKDSVLGNILSTPAGEALVAGLGAEALQRLFGTDDENEGQRPFGYGNVPTNINFMRAFEANKGGQIPEYFPRRDGGIMPSEGSGTKDDVPAMLTAGEFVLTKEAVKGLGNGNQERGIAQAYKMMDNLERMA